MAWPSGGPATAVAGNVATASFVNTNYRDALDALVIGYTEIASLGAGDVLYASSANQLARVALGSANTPLVAGASAPEFDNELVPTAIDSDAPATPVANTLYANTIVKGYLVYNGVTNSILDEVNVDTVTDNGNGDYTVNWVTAFDDANYAVVAMAADDTTCGIQSIAAGSVRIRVRQGGGHALADVTPVCVIAVGRN